MLSLDQFFLVVLYVSKPLKERQMKIEPQHICCMYEYEPINLEIWHKRVNNKTIICANLLCECIIILQLQK